MKRYLVVASLVIAAMLAGCGNSTTPTLSDLPMPSRSSLPVTVSVQTIGSVEQVSMGSPNLNVNFFNTGAGAGGTETEVIEVNNKKASMIEYSWGSYMTDGEITSAQSYDPMGKVIEARITLKLSKARFLQIFACGACVLDRSRFILQYLPDSTGRLALHQATYLEEYGIDSNRGVVAFGPQAWWNNASAIFPEYSNWGFWETSVSPFDQVLAALASAQNKLASTVPSYMVVDEDGPSEVIGRQTGMKMYRAGSYTGDIVFHYTNLFGRMPNTPAIGKGALSRIEWRLSDGTYNALSVLSSKITARPSSIYVFSDNPKTAETVENSPWVPLYGQLSSGALPGVTLAVYSSGIVGKISQTVYTGDDISTVDIGEGGGVFYTVFGYTNLSHVKQARNLLDLMGRGGIKSTGFFYPTQPNAGNGMHYYLSALTLALSPNSLEVYGEDVGLLDRVGFPDFSIFER